MENVGETKMKPYSKITLTGTMGSKYKCSAYTISLQSMYCDILSIAIYCHKHNILCFLDKCIINIIKKIFNNIPNG